MDSNLKTSQQGSAVLMTVLILTTIIIVALNAANVVMSGTILSGVQERSTLAFYAAEAGAERVLYDIRYDGLSFNNDTNNIYGGPVTLSNNSYYTVDYATSSVPTPTVTATSRGSFLETQRNVEVTY